MRLPCAPALIHLRFNCQTTNAPLFLSFPRKRESIATGLSRVFGVWVPAFAGTTRGGEANAPPPVFFEKGAGYAFISCPFIKKGDGAPIGATFNQCTHLAMRGAFRRAIAAFFFRRRAALFVEAFGASSVSQLLAGALAPGGAPAPPEAVLARHGYGRRPDPHDTEQPVRVPSWDQAVWVYYPIGMLSRKVVGRCQRDSSCDNLS